MDPADVAAGRQHDIPTKLEHVRCMQAWQPSTQRIAKVIHARGRHGERPPRITSESECAVGIPVWIAQNGERDRFSCLIVAHSFRGLERHDEHLQVCSIKGGLLLAQLREVLTARQSPQPAEEDEQRWLAAPIRRAYAAAVFGEKRECIRVRHRDAAPM